MLQDFLTYLNSIVTQVLKLKGSISPIRIASDQLLTQAFKIGTPQSSQLVDTCAAAIDPAMASSLKEYVSRLSGTST